MGVLDWLTSGSTPKNTTTTSSSSSQLPQFMSDYLHGIITKANAVMDQPYTPYPGQRIASTSADTTRAQKMIRDNAGAFTPAMKAALSASTNVPGQASSWYNKARSGLDTAAGMDIAAVDPSKAGLRAAQPYLDKASGSFTGSTVGNYMNPYTSNVIDAATWDANRNFTNNILPGLADTFTRNGQFGSSEHENQALRAATDLTTGLQKYAAGEYGQAYDAARGAYQTDTGRYAQLGQTAGSLAEQDTQARLDAARNMGQFAGQYADTGTQQGQLGLAAANQAANIAGNADAMGMRDAAALASSGTDQEARQQQNLDTEYHDFLAQRDHQKNQLDWGASIGSGVPTSSTSTSSSTGPASSYGPSLASTLGGLYSIYKGVSSARGGLIQAARGGLTDIMRRAAENGAREGGQSFQSWLSANPHMLDRPLEDRRWAYVMSLRKPSSVPAAGSPRGPMRQSFSVHPSLLGIDTQEAQGGLVRAGLAPPRYGCGGLSMAGR